MTILPGETKEVPAGYESSPALKMYADLGFLRVVETAVPKKSGVADSVPDAAKKSAPKVTAEDAAFANVDRQRRFVDFPDNIIRRTGIVMRLFVSLH